MEWIFEGQVFRLVAGHVKEVYLEKRKALPLARLGYCRGVSKREVGGGVAIDVDVKTGLSRS